MLRQLTITTHLAYLLVSGYVFSVGNSVPAEVSEMNSQQIEASFSPGQETKVVDSQSGELGYYLVYVPEDYTPARTWPVVLFYHGLGGKPHTALFRPLLHGKKFIVVGMEYYMRGLGGYEYMATRDVQILKHVLDSLEEKLRIDQDGLFVAGFSKGAFYTSGLLNELPELWAGAVILGGGNRTAAKNTEALKAKPIFIGCGDQDGFLDYAEKACEYYESLNCEVTLEKWPGVGHWVSERSSMGRWLLEHAPIEKSQAPPGLSNTIARLPVSAKQLTEQNPKTAKGALRLVRIVFLTSVGIAAISLGLWYFRRRLNHRSG